MTSPSARQPSSAGVNPTAAAGWPATRPPSIRAFTRPGRAQQRPPDLASHRARSQRSAGEAPARDTSSSAAPPSATSVTTSKQPAPPSMPAKNDGHVAEQPGQPGHSDNRWVRHGCAAARSASRVPSRRALTSGENSYKWYRQAVLVSGRLVPVKTAADVVAAVQALAGRDNRPVLVALDGRSGSGKTTLSHQLATEVLSAAVIEADDFFSGGSHAQWSQLSGQQRADLCIDWRRLRQEALIPLLAGNAATWRPFDWDTEADLMATPTVHQPSKLVILDGAFSSRPELLDLIDYTVLVQAQDAVRRQRLAIREGETFITEWYPIWNEAENYYYAHVRPTVSFDAVVVTSHALDPRKWVPPGKPAVCFPADTSPAERDPQHQRRQHP